MMDENQTKIEIEAERKHEILKMGTIENTTNDGKKKERKKIQTATRIYRTASVDETDEILQVKIYIHIVDGWLVCPFRFCKPQFSTGFIASHFDFDFDLFRLFSFNTFLSTFIHWIEL